MASSCKCTGAFPVETCHFWRFQKAEWLGKLSKDRQTILCSKRVPPFPFSGLLKVPPFSLWWKPPANCNLRALEDIQRPLQQLQVYRCFPSGNLPLWEVPRRENRLADTSAFLLMTFQKWRSRWTLRFQEVGSRRRLASGLALAGVEPEGQDALRGPRLLQVVDQGRQASASAHVGAGRVGMHLGVGSQK